MMKKKDMRRYIGQPNTVGELIAFLWSFVPSTPLAVRNAPMAKLYHMRCRGVNYLEIEIPDVIKNEQRKGMA